MRFRLRLRLGLRFWLRLRIWGVVLRDDGKDTGRLHEGVVSGRGGSLIHGNVDGHINRGGQILAELRDGELGGSHTLIVGDCSYLVITGAELEGHPGCRLAVPEETSTHHHLVVSHGASRGGGELRQGELCAANKAISGGDLEGGAAIDGAVSVGVDGTSKHLVGAGWLRDAHSRHGEGGGGCIAHNGHCLDELAVQVQPHLSVRREGFLAGAHADGDGNLNLVTGGGHRADRGNHGGEDNRVLVVLWFGSQAYWRGGDGVGCLAVTRPGEGPVGVDAEGAAGDVLCGDDVVGA